MCPADALKLADAAKVIEVHGAMVRPCEDFDVPGVRYGQSDRFSCNDFDVSWPKDMDYNTTI